MFEYCINQANDTRHWVEISDISVSTSSVWSEALSVLGVDTKTSYLPIRLSDFEVKQRKRLIISLLNSVTKEWDKVLIQFSKPHLFVFTDIYGVVLEMKGSKRVMHKLQECNIGLGTSFALEHTGINGISLAMEMKKPALVIGKDHHLELFSECMCVCQPLIVDGDIHGYINLSTHSDENFTWAFVLLGKLVMDIEQKYLSDDPHKKQQIIMENLSLHGLSSREQEIAWRWLNNQSTLKIAAELYITEGTVRNHIKKVYAKTGVCEKGRFIMKFG